MQVVTVLNDAIDYEYIAQSVVRDAKENREKKMAAQNPGVEERVKGGITA